MEEPEKGCECVMTNKGMQKCYKHARIELRFAHWLNHRANMAEMFGPDAAMLTEEVKAYGGTFD